MTSTAAALAATTRARLDPLAARVVLALRDPMPAAALVSHLSREDGGITNYDSVIRCIRKLRARHIISRTDAPVSVEHYTLTPAGALLRTSLIRPIAPP